MLHYSIEMCSVTVMSEEYYKSANVIDSGHKCLAVGVLSTLGKINRKSVGSLIYQERVVGVGLDDIKGNFRKSRLTQTRSDVRRSILVQEYGSHTIA